jgi:YD repeat-containing protein
VVYSRTLNYNGERLTGEVITHQGGSSHIEYKYDKQGRLVEADCDADHSLDGRSRKVHFVVDDKGKG